MTKASLAVGAVFLAAFFALHWWLRQPIDLPPLSGPIEQNTPDETRRPLTWEDDGPNVDPGREFRIRNQNEFAWTNVRIDVADRRGVSHCPRSSSNVDAGSALVVQPRFCLYVDGRTPTEVCSIHVEANEGAMGTELGACARVH